MTFRSLFALVGLFLAVLPVLTTGAQETGTLFVEGDKVGIGTSTPDVELHTGKGQSGRNEIRVESSDAGPPVIGFKSGIRHYEFQADTVGNWLIRDVSSNTVPFVIEPGSPQNTLRIDNDGRIGINTGSPQAALDVAGGIRLTSLGTGSSTHVCWNSSNRLSTCSSSARYKDVIGPLSDNVRELVDAVTPMTFTWKAAYNRSPSPAGSVVFVSGHDGTLESRNVSRTDDFRRRHLGFIAENVHAAADQQHDSIPLLTFNDSAGRIEGVDFDALVAVLWRNVQLLNQENQELKARIAALEAARGGDAADAP